MLWVHFLLVPVAIFVVCKAADWLVMSSSRMARAWGMSELVIGIILVGFGTSAPEFAASATASILGLDEVSVANVIGSNGFNICLILGLCSIIFPLMVDRVVLRFDLPVLILATVVTILFIFFWGPPLTLTRIEAGILFGGLLAYLGLRVRLDKRVEVAGANKARFRVADLVVFIGSVALLTGSAHVMVDSSVAIAQWFGISQWVIGVTVIAAGTSLPELAASVAAAVRKKHDISVGNLVGSCIFNLFGVLGFAGFLMPLTLAPANQLPLLLILPATVIAGTTMWIGKGVSRLEGVILVLAFIAFWVAGLL